jgi:hypothetical protein
MQSYSSRCKLHQWPYKYLLSVYLGNFLHFHRIIALLAEHHRQSYGTDDIIEGNSTWKGLYALQLLHNLLKEDDQQFTLQ